MDEPQSPGRRIRAALALAGRTSIDVAPELNISVRTLDRIISGQRMPRDWELRRLAEILEVPGWFLERGVSPDDPPPGENRTAEQWDEIARLREQLGDEVARLGRVVDQLEQSPAVEAPARPSRRRAARA